MCYCFRDVAPYAVAVLVQVKVRIRFHPPLLFKRFCSSRGRRYFVRQWGTRGVVASVSDGQLVVHLCMFLCCLLRFTSCVVHWRC